MYEPRISITSRSISFYEFYHGERRSRSGLFNPLLRAKSNGGSRHVFKRIKLAINTLIDTSSYKTVFVRSTGTYFRYKINFITLTLSGPQMHPDSYIIKEMLSKFLEAWQKRRKGLLYVWKAEVQDNGRLHFHITSNAFYHYERLRRDWNRYQRKHGYIDSGIDYEPNSTDVHSVSKIKNLSTYLAGYFLKKDSYTRVLKRFHKLYDKHLKRIDAPVYDLPSRYLSLLKRKVVGTVWGCSKCLLVAKVSVWRHDPSISNDLSLLIDIDYMAIKTDYSLSYFFDHFPDQSLPAIYAHYKKHMAVVLKMQHDSIISEVIDKL